MKIYNGDCLEIMKDIDDESINLILCDLPYGTTKCSWDIIIPFDKLWEQYKRIIKFNGAIVLFASQPFTSQLILSNINWFKYCWYWEKERLTNITQVKKRAGKTIEELCVFYNKQPTYNPQMTIYTGKPRKNKIKNGTLGALVDSNKMKNYEYQDNGLRYPTQLLKFNRDVLKSNLHQTQKPVALLENMINTYTNIGDIVLDNTMGSGSTGIACINTNREFVGIELDENYFNIAKNRLENHIVKRDNDDSK